VRRGARANVLERPAGAKTLEHAHSGVQVCCVHRTGCMISLILVCKLSDWMVHSMFTPPGDSSAERLVLTNQRHYLWARWHLSK
jgi:hypothetical protein